MNRRNRGYAGSRVGDFMMAPVGAQYQWPSGEKTDAPLQNYTRYDASQTRVEPDEDQKTLGHRFVEALDKQAEKREKHKRVSSAKGVQNKPKSNVKRT